MAPIAASAALSESGESLAERLSIVGRRVAKGSAIRVLTAARVDQTASHRAWRNQRLLILGYHGVSVENEHEWNPRLFMRAATFRERMETLKSMGASVLRLSDAIQRLQRGTLPPLATAITFDDGYANFSSRALPILQELELPATLYLTSWYSQHRQPIASLMLGFVLWRNRRRGFVRFSSSLGGIEGVETGSDSERARSQEQLLAAIHRVNDGADRFALTERICRAIDPDYQSLVDKRALQLLAPEDLRELPSHLVDVELHTHRHRSPDSRELYLREITDNRAFIEELRPVKPAHFCYPSGGYQAIHLPWLDEAGIVSATTCEPSLASRDDHPLLLPRLIERETMTLHEFKAWVSGLWPKISDWLSPPSSREITSRRRALRETR